MRDPYEILGVSRASSGGDIKGLSPISEKYHPDRNKDDVKSKERFSEINSAYEILGDEAKKAQFDRGEIGVDGKPRGFDGFGAGPGGYSQAWRQNGASGAEQHFEFNFGGGRGGGFEDFFDLFGGGRRRAKPEPTRGEDVSATATVTLETLAKGGPVRVILPNGRTLEVKVPAGVEDGKQIRLRGQGQTGVGGKQAGDALITIKFAPIPISKLRAEISN